MPTVVFSAIEVRRLMTDPFVLAHFDRKAEEIADEIRDHLSTPYSGPRSRNPPPGPPEMRSGDMVNSIEISEPTFNPINGFNVFIFCEAYHRGFNYPQHLVDQGYQFSPFG